MRILIIGSEGYIGSELYRILSSSHEVIGADHKNLTGSTIILTDYDTEFIHNFNVIIYLGGKSTRQMTVDDICKNVDDVVKLAGIMASDQLLIYSSTTAVYEGLESATENSALSEILDPYSQSMLLRERQIQLIPNIRTIGLRLATVVGISPRQRSDRLHIQMLKSAVFTGRIHISHPFSLRPILSFVDFSNCIELILKHFDKNVYPPGHEIYNISSFNTSVVSVASTLALKTGAKCIFHESIISNKGFSCSSHKFETCFNMKFVSTNETIIDELLTVKNVLVENWNNLKISQTLQCLVCSNKNLIEMIDLGEQPLANQFILDLDDHQNVFPLSMHRCNKCYHHQLSHIQSPEDLFTNYIYVSGTTQTGEIHFSDFCKLVISDTGKMKGVVLDIASNDGSQLDKFKLVGWKTIGVDPARNLEPIASSKGHKIIVGFWGDEQITTQLSNESFDAIVAQNVFAHVPNPRRFLEMCKQIMNSDTKLYIQTSQAEILQNAEFDTIYHEHISFFTVKSMERLTSSCGLYLEDVRKVPIHGTSYIFIIRKMLQNCSDLHSNPSEKVLKMMKEEDFIYSDTCPITFREHANEKSRILISMIKRFVKDGFKVVGYGASAKGNTLLNFIYGGKVDTFENDRPPKLEYIVDENPMKQNRVTPGTKIKVVGLDALKNEVQPVAIVVLAWNFLEEIKKKIITIQNTNKKIVLCVPFPSPCVWFLSSCQWERMSCFPICRSIEPTQSKQKTLLITHFYNEEFILPFWIAHHAPMFDEAILIDYQSTDKSCEYIRRFAPSSWKIVPSRNAEFDAYNCDAEVEHIEKSYPDDVWKTAITVTEFFIWPTMKEDLEKFNLAHIQSNRQNIYRNFTQPQCLRIGGFSICGDDTVPLRNDLPLVQQRAYFSNHNSGHCRYLHRYTSKITVYKVGRHQVNMGNTLLTNAFLFKYMISPWPESIPRKLQIGARQSLRDIQLRHGDHHQNNLQQLKNLKILYDSQGQYDIFSSAPTKNPNALVLSKILHEQLQLPWSSKS